MIDLFCIKLVFSVEFRFKCKAFASPYTAGVLEYVEDWGVAYNAAVE
jgi:hypothetical protein